MAIFVNIKFDEKNVTFYLAIHHDKLLHLRKPWYHRWCHLWKNYSNHVHNFHFEKKLLVLNLDFEQKKLIEQAQSFINMGWIICAIDLLSWERVWNVVLKWLFFIWQHGRINIEYRQSIIQYGLWKYAYGLLCYVLFGLYFYIVII